MEISEKQRQQIIHEHYVEKMRKLGSMKSPAKARAARENGLKNAANLRTSTANLIRGAKAVAKGMTIPKAARQVAKCRTSTLEAFLQKWKVPASK